MKIPHLRGLKRPKEWIALLGLLLLVALINSWDTEKPALPDNGTLKGQPRLVDGDSFHLGAYEVRLQGIDAPEGRQICERDGKEWACGEASRRELKNLIRGRPITCEASHLDKHGRALATCKAGSTNLNREMVSSGFAVAFGSRYASEEQAARSAKRGLWVGYFERPQDWRRKRGIGGGR